MRRGLTIMAAAAAVIVWCTGTVSAATVWTIQTTPEPAGASEGYLQGVSCVSAASCTAVGYYRDSAGALLTLAEHWDGMAWAIQATPNPTGTNVGPVYLEAVSCASATSCTAVGNYRGSSGVERTLAEVRDGSTWTIQATPNPAGSAGSYLQGISCQSAGSCTATRHYSSSAGATVTLAERWDGTAWG